MRLASDKIGVAVSSISRQIAQLEKTMGVALIERGRRAIRVTGAGRLAYEYYQGCIANEEAFMNRLHEHRQLKAGKVSIAIGEDSWADSFPRCSRISKVSIPASP